MGRIIKWIVIGVVALAIIGFITSPDAQRGYERGVDEALGSPTPTAEATPEPAAVGTPYVLTAEDERTIFELSIDLTIDDTDMTDICSAIDVLGVEQAADLMHDGYGDGYWDAAYVESALLEACS